MSLTVVTSGTTAALTPGVETDLEAARAPAAPTTYVYAVDMAALASGEVCFMRVYFVLLASGTVRLAYFGSFIGTTDADPLQLTVPIPVDSGTGITVKATLLQKNGSGRAFPWKLYSL